MRNPGRDDFSRPPLNEAMRLTFAQRWLRAPFVMGMNEALLFEANENYWYRLKLGTTETVNVRSKKLLWTKTWKGS